MSWAEEQPWFGLEDFALEACEEQDSVEYITVISHYPAWKMFNGELIAIKDMTTSHIKNCIRMIYRKNGTWRHQYLRYFELELRRRKFNK